MKQLKILWKPTLSSEHQEAQKEDVSENAFLPAGPVNLQPAFLPAGLVNMQPAVLPDGLVKGEAMPTTFCLKEEKFCVTHQIELVQKKVKTRRSIKTRLGTYRNGYNFVKTWICPARLDLNSEWSALPGGQTANFSKIFEDREESQC